MAYHGITCDLGWVLNPEPGNIEQYREQYKDNDRCGLHDLIAGGDEPIERPGDIDPVQVQNCGKQQKNIRCQAEYAGYWFEPAGHGITSS